jgi:hypothetical protein
MSLVMVRGFKLRSQARQAYGDEALISRFSGVLTLRGEIPEMVGWIAAAILLSITCAMPVRAGGQGQIPHGSTRVVAVIDVSPSMAAEDHRNQFPPQDGTPAHLVLGPYGRRIDEVRLAIEQQLIPTLAGNELGIVLFAGEGKDQVDLDDDFEKIHWEFAHGWMEISSASGDGSDYGKGLATALKAFDNSQTSDEQNVIILFSDGGADNLDRKALARTIQKIKAAKIKVIVVAVGGDTEMKVNTYNAQGVATGYVHLENCEDKDNQGNCQTKLDLKELGELANDFNTTPVRLNVDAKLPFNWASAIAGSRADNQKQHLYRFFLTPCLIIVLMILLRDFISVCLPTKPIA